MNQKWKKVISVTVAVVVIVGAVIGGFFLFSGRGSLDNEEVNLEVKLEELTGTVQVMLPGSEPNNFRTIQQKLNEQLKSDGRNYTVNFSFFSYDNYWSKVGLNARSDYDVFSISQYYLADIYSQNLLADLSKIIEKFAPDYLTETDEYIRKATQIDGKTLYISADVPLAGEDEMLMTTTRWLERAEMTEITSLQQLETFLERCQAYLEENNLDDSTYLLSRDSGSFLKREFCKNYYYPLGQWGQTPVYIDLANKENGKYVVKNFFESDGFKSIADINAKWYDLGYKPTNYADISDMEGAFNNDLLATIWNNALKESERAETFHAISGNDGNELYNIVLNPEETMWIQSGSTSGLAVYGTSKRQIQAVDFINLLRQQKYFDLLTFGELGVNYNLTEDGRYVYEATETGAAISARNKYSLLGNSSAYSTLNTIRFSRALSETGVQRYLNWDSRPEVRVSPFSAFRVRLDSEMDRCYTVIKNAMSKYCDQLTFGYYSREDRLPNATRTVYDQMLYEMNVNDSMTKFIAAIQAQVDAYCEANGL